MTADRPLAGIRVVDAVSGPLAVITRYLSDLGARVDRIVPPGEGAEAVAANAGKVVHETGLPNRELASLLDRAHVIVADCGFLPDLTEFRAKRPGLVTMTVSDFGSDNSFSGWQATGPVLHALSAELSRSGIRGRAPLLPPGDLAYQCAAPQAALALLGALHRVLSGGAGAHFDFSALDGAVQALDPGFGISGSATLGKPAGLLVRDRPRKGFQYPIYNCADGYVRLCILSKRQWRGMFAWMGEPEQFSSPDFDKTANRYASKDLIPFIAGFLAGKTRAQVEREAQEFNVPASALLSLSEFVASDHVAARNAVARLPDGSLLPNGNLMIDGERMGPSEQVAEGDFPKQAESAAPDRPLAGLKVLDLGVIVVGAEQGRLLADLGADVIKVESRAYPDGNRQSYLEHGMSVSFAAGHRNKRSMGIDLRSEEGKVLFLRMVREADVVCSNFKPGTMEKLGLGEDVLRTVNPRVIVSESSAFGDTGPWSARMGYGPLVRAATGLTLAWRYPDDQDGFSDSITIYPDHVAGRICAIGVLALLIRRLRTKAGGVSRVAQSEVMLSHFAADVLRGTDVGQCDIRDWPWGVFPAKGEDEWCVISIRGDDDWSALCKVIGYEAGRALDSPAKRLAARDEISEALCDWLADQAPQNAAAALQSAGVPAAPMLRLAELPEHRYFTERGFYRVEGHPWLKEQVFAESFIVPTRDLLAPADGAAPLSGEQTQQVISDWLGLSEAEIMRLCDEGVLEPLSTVTRRQAEEFMASTG